MLIKFLLYKEMILETKMKHNKIKSRHKHFGIARIMSTLGVFATVALGCVCIMSSTAHCGVPHQIEEMNEQISAFEAKVEALSIRIKDSVSGGLSSAQAAIIANTDEAEDSIIENTDEAEEAIIANTDEAEASINDFIRATHLVDPFDVAVSVCTEIEGSAGIEGGASFAVPATLEAGLGIDFFGSGVKIKIEPSGEIGVGIGLNTDVGMSVVACINGIFTRQNQDIDEEDAMIASVPVSEQAFITELIETGNRYRNRVKGSAIATKLVEVSDNGFDKLNTSLDAFEGITTLNAQALGQFIVATFDGSDTSPLGTFVGDLSNASGIGIDGVLTDFAGIVNLTGSGFLSINDSLSSSIGGLNLGAVGAGLDGLLDLSSIETSFDAFDGIDDAVDAIEDLVDDVIAFFEGVISGLNDVIDCLEDPLSCI